MIARVQVALLVALVRRLPGLYEARTEQASPAGAPSSVAIHVSSFDPLMDARERAALELLGVRTLQDNVECRHVVEHPTIFFMPHCTAQMYSNVLEANWANVSSPGFVLLGNDLDEVLNTTRLQGRDLASLAPLVEAAPHASKTPWQVPEDFGCVGAFNELASHRFGPLPPPPTPPKKAKRQAKNAADDGIIST